MKQFSGFPVKDAYAPVPLAFFSALLPEITDVTELKAILHLFRILIPMKRNPQFVTFSELAGDANLMFSLKSGNEQPSDTLRRAIDMAVKRSCFLHLSLGDKTTQENIYLLNTKRNQENIEKIKSGELRLPRLEIFKEVEVETRPQRNIFALYEENIGLITPMIAEEIKEAEKLYPESWINDAFIEAVNANKRSWRFISFLLERWSTEGKKNGTYQRNLKTTDPDKYFKDKYGRFFQR
jgi:DnaD/phage-associated family protein